MCFCARSSSPIRALQDVERRLDHAERVAQLVPDRADELTEGGEALLARLLREQIFAVGVQHDRELEVEDLAERDAGVVQLARAARGRSRR